jgi:hypothetical protein
VFTLNGETGKSVSQYAGQWLKLVGSTKKLIKGQKPLRNSDVLVSMLLIHVRHGSSSSSSSNCSSIDCTLCNRTRVPSFVACS